MQGGVLRTNPKRVLHTGEPSDKWVVYDSFPLVPQDNRKGYPQTMTRTRTVDIRGCCIYQMWYNPRIVLCYLDMNWQSMRGASASRR